MHSHELDDILLGVFRKMGVDFAKQREVNFFFILPVEVSAQQCAKILRDMSFSPDISLTNVPWWKRLFVKPDWLVRISKNMPLDEQTIKNYTTKFRQIATRCEGSYDGWEACLEGENLTIEDVQ